MAGRSKCALWFGSSRAPGTWLQLFRGQNTDSLHVFENRSREHRTGTQSSLEHWRAGRGDRLGRPPSGPSFRSRLPLVVGMFDASDRSPRQPLKAVVGRILVCLAPGGGAERGVDELIDGPSPVDDGLARVDELAGIVTEDVNAEERPVVAPEHQFHQPLSGSRDRGLGIFGEPSLADLMLHPRARAASSVRPTMAT